MVMIVKHNNPFGGFTPSLEHRLNQYSGPSTLVIKDFPDYSVFRKILQSDDFFDRKIPVNWEFDIKMGVSRCHPLDMFSRKVGISLAESRMEDVKCVVQYIGIEANTDIAVCCAISSPKTVMGSLITVRLGSGGRTYVDQMTISDLYDTLYSIVEDSEVNE